MHSWQGCTARKWFNTVQNRLWPVQADGKRSQLSLTRPLCPLRVLMEAGLRLTFDQIKGERAFPFC